MSAVTGLSAAELRAAADTLRQLASAQDYPYPGGVPYSADELDREADVIDEAVTR